VGSQAFAPTCVRPLTARFWSIRRSSGFGGVDILVSNSGGPPSGAFEEHPANRWLETVDEHLGSLIALVHGVLPGMRAQRWGRILAITSIAVKQPIAGLILSNTARAAVAGFARTLANEVAADNITVNNVMPGYTLTARVEQLSGVIAEADGRTAAEVTAGWASEIPMARLGTPEEFAALVTFLASERASYITGTSIPVDGGWTKALL
jgi:3-oxoacyl-[acyl-carrier protein] reductase